MVSFFFALQFFFHYFFPSFRRHISKLFFCSCELLDLDTCTNSALYRHTFAKRIYKKTIPILFLYPVLLSRDESYFHIVSSHYWCADADKGSQFLSVGSWLSHERALHLNLKCVRKKSCFTQITRLNNANWIISDNLFAITSDLPNRSTGNTKSNVVVTFSGHTQG